LVFFVFLNKLFFLSVFFFFFRTMAIFSIFRKNQKTLKSPGFVLAEKKSMSSASGARPHHGYHLVDPSPWPAMTRFCL
jgi:hypothetical protein